MADSSVEKLIHGRRTVMKNGRHFRNSVVDDDDDDDDDGDDDVDLVESIQAQDSSRRDVLLPAEDAEMLPRVTSASSSDPDRAEAKSAKLDKLKAKIRDKLLLSKTTNLAGSTAGRKVGFVQSSDSMDAEETVLKQRLEQKTLRRAESSYNEKFQPSSEEAYDFFTSTWNEDFLTRSPQSSSSSASGIVSPSKSSRGTSDQQESSKVVGLKSGESIEKISTKENAGDVTDKSRLLASEVLELEDRWQLFQYVPAVYRPHEDRLRDEETTLFYPSNTPVPMAEKLPEQSVARHLADEGLYVGRVPAMHPRNRNKMEHRLLRNGELKWFGEDGSILSMADPASDVTQRPPFSGDDAGPADLLTEYRKPLLAGCRAVLGGLSEALQLDVDVAEVTFLHHHLFSKEHVLALRLTQYCRQFDERRRSSSVDIIMKRLEVLRRGLANVRDALSATAANFDPTAPEGEPSARDPSRQRQQEYVREVRSLRQQLDREESTDRSILRAILGTWRLLRSLRDSQGYSNTPVQLQIVKKEVDKDEDLTSWHRAIDAELEEEREDHATKYAVLVNEYEVKLSEWRKWKRRMKLKKKRKTGEEPADGSSTGADIPAESMDEPQPPQTFDECQTRNRIREKALQIRRRPGEPILYPELTNSNPVTPLEQCPSGEQRRRRDVARCKVFVKVMFNDKKASQTATKNLGQDFVITFGEIFNLRLAQCSESLSLQICEVRSLSTHQIAEIFLPVSKPDDVQMPASSVRLLEDHEFSSDKVVAHNHDAVGSGLATTTIGDTSEGKFDVKTDVMPATVLLTSGVLRCRAVWTSGLERGRLEIQDSNPPATVFGDMTKLKSWLENTTIDPNDPANAHLVQFLEGGFLTSLGRDYFFLDDSLCDLDPGGSSLTDFFEGHRFRAIRLRHEEVPEFRNMRMIPMRNSDVPKEPFIAYEKRLKEEAEPTEADEEDEYSYRQKFSKYLHKMRGEVWKRYLYGKRPKELEDVVTEDQIPDIGMIGTTFMKWTDKTRPLRPVRGERKKVIGQSIGSSGGAAASRVSILVNIANAFNVPVRKETSKTSKQFGFVRQPTTTTLLTISEPLVSPVIEVTFQQKTERTNASSGPNPCWNHDMQLEFRASDENYSPANLQTVRDVIFFNLFDEVIVDILEDERDRGSHVHQRIDKRWLGTLQIPFSTLYLNTRIEGTFKMSCPPLLLGYNKDGGGISGLQQQQQQQPNVFGNNQVLLKKDHTYLSIFLTLEPVLPLPEPLKENLESNESKELLAKADQFKRWFTQSFPKRQLKTTVVYVNGKSVFVTRFIRELAPPHELIELATASNESLSELVARFVSLIPVVSDVVVFPGICDIWTTNDQFLSVLAGDQEEHAVLLCNYFLYLKLKAFLLLGFAVPDGVSVYVLTQNEMSYTAWNANTSECFDVQDSFCPIQSVGCLINRDNIWVNIQPDCQPSRMSFDVNNARNWRPFFDHKFPNPGLTSIQPEKITYVRTESAFIEQLRDKIEVTVRNKIMAWRKRFRTSWNRHCGQVLRKILLKMEQSRIGAFNEDEVQSELYPILSVYKMCGFPLSTAYAEMSAILEAVFATGVHLAEGTGLEFALAVHVHPYPHNVVAVWLYVASLHKR